MPWTEPGSRDEWLAEVRRRGERIRRRRRLAVTVAGAVALVLPVVALASFTAGRRAGPDLRVAASGPAPTGGLPTTASSSGGADEPIPKTVVAGAPGVAESAPPAQESPSTTAEVHRRVASINGVEVVPTTTVLFDDPVVRTTLPPPSNVTGGRAPFATTTTVATDEGPVSPCPASEVSVTVVVDRSSYAAGEPVKGSTSIENRSATTCLLAPREAVHVEDASGRTVGNFPYTMEFRQPVVAAPGRTLTGTFSWDQKDCSRSACAQVPAGAYTAVATWPLTGPTPSQSAAYGPARASFQIGGS